MKMSDNKAILVVAAVWIVIGIIAMTQLNQNNSVQSPAVLATDFEAGELIRIVNDARVARGLNALGSHPSLQKAADIHAEEVARNKVVGASFKIRAESGYPPDAEASLLVAWGENKGDSVFDQITVPPFYDEVIYDPRWQAMAVSIAEETSMGGFWLIEFGSVEQNSASE